MYLIDLQWPLVEENILITLINTSPKANVFLISFIYISNSWSKLQEQDNNTKHPGMCNTSTIKQTYLEWIECKIHIAVK